MPEQQLITPSILGFFNNKLNQNIKDNPFTVLNDPNISHEDSRYVFASVSFNSIIDKFLLDSAADLESGNLENVSDAAKRAKKASLLKFSGEFKNAKELQTSPCAMPAKPERFLLRLPYP